MADDFSSGDEVWDLLGRAPRCDASPWFADRVLREVEVPVPTEPMGWWRWALPLATGGALAALALTSVVSEGPGEARFSVVAPVVEFETINNLDLIVINNESSLWLDPASSF